MIIVLLGIIAFLCTGPAFNLFLRECNFNIGPFVVNKYTSPGVSIIMVVVSYKKP